VLCGFLAITAAAKAVFPVSAHDPVASGMGLDPVVLTTLAAMIEGALAGAILTTWWRVAAWGAFGLSVLLIGVVALRLLGGNPGGGCGCLGSLAISPQLESALVLGLAVLSAGCLSVAG